MAEGHHQKVDVAILGGGFAGVYCAKALRKELGPTSNVRIALISDENYMVFQPMLPEVAGASISPRHVVNPLRLLCQGTDVFKARVERIDWPGRKLDINAGAFTGNIELRFEHLVLALGATVDLSRIPGMPEHAFLMQNVGDAMLLRTTIIGRIEEASLESRPDIKSRLLTFVVVGGGYSGVETAGHILDLFRAIHVYYPNVDEEDLQVYLVHSRDHLLPTLSRRLGDYSAEKLQERGLKLLLNKRVKAVTAHRVYLQEGETIETNTIISTVGTAPHPLVVRLCKENGFANAKGRIHANDQCRVEGQTHLWAAGDCAAIPFVKGGFCPDTAQFAMRQGAVLGKNIARIYENRSLIAFTFKGYGEMASIGRHIAVGSIMGYNFSGFVAWWLWRTIYLAKLPRFDRKLRVVLDWTLDLFFPPDINLLSPRFSSLFKEIHLQTGDFVFHRGEPAFSFYIVKEGAIELLDEKGVVNIITAGEYFGERALLGDQLFRFDGRAQQPTRLVSIPANIFHQMVHGTGSLGRLFKKSANKYQSREIIEAITSKLPPQVMKLHASDLMAKNVKALRTEMPISDVLGIAKSFPHSLYPVVDGEGQIKGVVKREDFYEFLKRADVNRETLLKEMPLGELPSVGPETAVPELMERFIRSGTNKLLVTDANNRLLGVVTVMDLITDPKKQE